MLEQRIGTRAFSKVLGDVQRRFAAKRGKRKRTRALEASLDPMAFAARKIARNRQKAEAAKKKRRAFGEMRRAGGSRGSGKHRPGKGGKGTQTSARGSVGGLAGGGKSTGGFGRKRARG